MKNQHLKLLFTLIIFSFALNGYSQLEIPLISQRNKCKAFDEIQYEEKNQIDDAIIDGFIENEYSGSIEALKAILDESKKPLSSKGKLYALDKIIDTYVCDIEMDDSCIYNLSKVDYGFIFVEDEEYTKAERETYSIRISKAAQGYEVINNYFEEAIGIADIESTEYFKKKRLYYTVQSSLLDEQYTFNFLDEYKNGNYWELENLNEIIGKGESKGLDMQAFKQVNEDYKATDYEPYPEFMGLNIGLSSFYGRDLWLGAEISSDFVQFANPFKLFDPVSSNSAFRISSLAIGYHKNIQTNDNDISLNSLRLTSVLFFNLTPAQFGFKWGPSFANDKTYWYYRPEIGFTYGIFTVSYGYNLMFNKNVRELTDKSVINFKISYPIIKLSR